MAVESRPVETGYFNSTTEFIGRQPCRPVAVWEIKLRHHAIVERFVNAFDKAAQFTLKVFRDAVHDCGFAE